MYITIYQQNPMINFRKIALNQQKPKFKKVWKYPLNAWNNAWKHENKNKRRGIKVLPALWEKNLAKIRQKTTKNLLCSLAKSERERKVWKMFWKSVWISQSTVFKKLETQCSIDWTCFSINRTSCFKFFKNRALTNSNTFSKLFSNFSLSLRLGKATQKIFCRFLPNFCKVFLPQGR